MADLTVKQKQIFDNYKKTHPQLSDAEILSALVNLGQIQLSEEQKLSLFNNSTNNDSGMGLKLEHTQKSANPTNQAETVFLQSGRKIVITKTQDGKDVYKYYATDGTQLKPDYFKKQEGVVRVSANRKTYTVTKNGNTTVKEAKDPLMAKIDQQQSRLNKTKNEQGFLGKSWDWIKNTTGIGDGSDKAQKQIEAERKLLNQIKTGKISKKDFKEVTGVEYSQENLEKFKRGELSQATAKIDGYKEGQEMASDVAGDMISGIAAVGIYTAAVAAAPFTGGASIAVGVAAATTSGALIKAGVKALDTVGTDRKYTLKDFGHDTATGAFSGALAPITGGLGGAVGKTVATKLGIQAVKQVGKEVAEEAVEQGVKQGVKQGIKTALTNPTGYEYVGGTLVKRGTALAAEMATDGALGGAIDGGFRAGLDNDWDANAILSGTIEGGIGGALMAPIIGGGMKGVGIAFNRIKGVDEFSSLVSNCDKLADDDLKELYKYYKTLEIESNYKGKEIPDIKKSSFEKLMQEIETRKINVDDIEIKNRYLLEGDVSPDDLSEVAPFAQYLTEEKHIGDIVVPNKENVEIVNGDFVNGEFVPDGSVTVYAHGNNPLNKKSFTWQRTSYPSFLVAQNKKELTQQILDILGDKKINKYKIKEIDEILQKNPELKISDLSEILGYLNNIGHARHFIQQGLSSVKDFKSFKANVKNYGEFLYQLEHANHGYQIRDISGAKFEDYHFNDFMNFIEKIDPENFEANCNAFLNMRGYFKNYLHPKDFLSTVHDKKCLERIQILDDFNYEHTDWSRTSRYNEVGPFYNLDVLSDDKKFAELLERMEYCKKAKLYSQPDANAILHWGDNFESFKKFDSSIPENLKYDIYKFYNDIFVNCPDNIDKFIEFCNKMPEDWFKEYFRRESYGYANREEICNLFMNFGAECYDEKWYKTVENGYWVHKEFQPKDRTPEELIKRIDLLKKVEHLLKYKYGKEEHIDVHVIDRILTVYDIKDIDKAMLFLNTADENYLRLIKLDNYHSGDSNTNYDLFKLINSENLDNMIENARVYNELSVDIQELFAKKAGWNFDIKFDIPTEDFKARIDIIKKYGEILDDDNLIKIFKGESNNIKAFERFAQLQKELKEQVQSVYSNYNIECLGILNDTGYQKFVSLVSEIKFKPDEFRNVLWNLNNNKILFEELSLDELKLIPHRIFEDNCYWLKIGKFRQRISQIPEKLRPYFKESNELLISYSTLFDSVEEYGIKSRDMMLKLGKFNKDDLDILGSNTIQTIIDEATYKDIELNILLQKIEEFKKIPKEGLELLKTNGRNMYDLLMSDNIDTKTITERFNLLIQRKLNSVIDSDNFYTLIRAGEEKYSIVKTLLENPNREIKDINSLIRSLPSSATVKKHHDYIFNNLINNPKNRTEEIPAQLNYIFRHEYFSFEEGSERLLKYDNQIEFSKKVINDLIKRDIHNEKDYPLLTTILFAIRENNIEETSHIEELKYNSIIKFMNSKNYDRIEIVRCYNNISRYSANKHIKLIEDMLNCANYDINTIQRIQGLVINKDNPNFTNMFISMLSHITKNNDVPKEYLYDIASNTNIENIDLVTRLCADKNLNFPVEYIPHLLKTNCTELTLKRLNHPQFIKDVIDIFKSGCSISTLFIQVYNLVGKNSLAELTKTEKREFIEVLLANKQNIVSGYLNGMQKEKIPLLPVSTDEYALTMKKIANSMNIAMETVSTEQIANFNKVISDFSNYLKSANLSKLEEINLTMPHTEFISRVENVIKHLPKEEQAKIQDFYGFKIIDGKLSGYPNINAKDLNLSEITDEQSIIVVNKLRKIIDDYVNNNFVTVKDNPLLNQQLKELSKVLPEIFNQIDGSKTSVNMIKSLQKIVKNSAFENLSESDKRVIMVATLLHNTDKTSNSVKESAFDALFIAKKFNMTDEEAQKVYSIIDASDFVEEFMKTQKRPTDVNIRAAIIGQEREDKFDLMAFKLKEGNNYELAQMLYSSKYQDGFTRHFDKILSDRIQQMKANDFILPQTPIETYLSHAQQKTITRAGNSYNVQVVESKDIKDFYAIIHTPEAGFATGGSRGANFANFDAFAILNDDKVICTSYVGNDMAGLVKEYHNGFIFDVQNDKQYVGYGRDIFSLAKNIPNMIVEYFRDRGFQANRGRGAKYEHRRMISNVLKSILYEKDYYNMSIKLDIEITSIRQKYKVQIDNISLKRKDYIRQKFGTDNITHEQFKSLKQDEKFIEIENQIKLLKKQQADEIQNIPGYADLKAMDKLYIKRLDEVKAKLGNRTMTLENIEEIDPEFAKAYREFLKRNGSEHTGEASLLRSGWHNEVLVSNPKISAIFTDDIDKIPEEYLIKAQEENLPIVIIK